MQKQSQHSSDRQCPLPFLRVYSEYDGERYRSETSPSQLLLLSTNTSRCSKTAATDAYHMSVHLAAASSAKRLLPELLPEQLATCFPRACCTFALPFDLRRFLELKSSSRSSDYEVASRFKNLPLADAATGRLGNGLRGRIIGPNVIVRLWSWFAASLAYGSLSQAFLIAFS